MRMPEIRAERSVGEVGARCPRRIWGQMSGTGVRRQLEGQAKLRLTVLMVIRGPSTKPKRLRAGPHVVSATMLMYGECMARLISTTVRLDEEDVRALKRARAAGHSASELIRKGLRIAASRYYSRRRPPSTRPRATPRSHPRSRRRGGTGFGASPRRNRPRGRPRPVGRVVGLNRLARMLERPCASND